MNASLAYSLFASLVGGVAAYFAAPLVACRYDRALRLARPRRTPTERERAEAPVPSWIRPLRTWLERDLEGAGYRVAWAWKAYLACLAGVPAVLFGSGLLVGRDAVASLALALAATACARAVVSARRTARGRALTRNAYKVYRFLDAQISSGIRPTDAIRGLHEATDDTEVRDVFVRFVAAYELSLDLGAALEEIRRSFSGYDAEMLCIGIRHCIETGGGGKMLWRMEELMFSKYFSGIQKETEGVRTRLVVAALLSASPLMMLFLLPVVFDAYQALGSIFQ